jgi:hypothetical protein
MLPIFSIFLPRENSGNDVSTRNRDIPFEPALGSVFAHTITRSTCTPLVIKVLEPLRIYSSPSFTALVRIPAESLPAHGSVIAIAATISPLAILGSDCSFLLLSGNIVDVGRYDIAVDAITTGE